MSEKQVKIFAGTPAMEITKQHHKNSFYAKLYKTATLTA